MSKERASNFFCRTRQIKVYIEKYNLSQKQLGQKLGLTPGAISNKLRLLNYTPAEENIIVTAGLSERHARTLLQIKGFELRFAAVQYVAGQKLNVAQTEEYVDALLAQTRFAQAI